VRPFSRKVLAELGALQRSLREGIAARNTALHLFAASRTAATPTAQREFWLEFSLLDQEYRATVRRLALFCARHRISESPTKRSA
jgi:hypothetical protein